MRIAQTRLSVDTAPREIKEITAEIARWVERRHIALGLLTVYIQHTSASLLIQENTCPTCGMISTPSCAGSCRRTCASIVTTTRGPTTCRRTSRVP